MEIRRFPALWILAGLLFSVVVPAPGWHHAGAVTRVEVLPAGVELEAGTLRVRIIALNDSVVPRSAGATR